MRKLLRAIGVIVVGLTPVLGAAPPDATIAEAAMRGDLQKVRSLLDEGADVNAARPDGTTALHHAAERGDVATVETLLRAGANANAATRIGAYSPMHLASRAGRAAAVRALLEAGGDAKAATTSGTTPLHLAAAAGSADAVAALVDHGADVNARESSFGQTPLIFAAAANRVDAIKALLARRADPNIRTNVVDVPALDAVDRAAERRRKQVLDEFRAAAPAAEQDTWRPSPSQVQAAIRAAREVQANPDAVDTKDAGKEEEPPAGGEGVAGYSASVGAQGGMTALLHAARQGHAEAALALLDGGASLSQVTADRTSPLLIATMNGHFDLALVLLRRGADPNVTSDAGAAPLFAALNLQWAPRARYPQPRAHDQQKATYLDVMKAMLDAGANPDTRLTKHLWYTSYNHCCSENIDGATAFWRAANATDVQAMRLLVAYGADFNVPAKARAPRPARATDKPRQDQSGLPPIVAGGPGAWPLHAAAGLGYGEGYESNAHRHVPDGWLPAVKYLVEELGVDVNVRDHNGYNAVHHAASRGDNELIKYLVSKGADVTVVSRRGQTTADMANGPYQRTLPYPETVALLESLGSKNNHRCVGC